MSRAVRWWVAAAIRLLPPRRRDLGEGMLAEAASVPPGRARWAWLAGGMWFVAGQVLVYRCAYWLALCGAAALVTVLDRVGTSDDAPQVVMAALLAVAAGLGWAVPRRGSQVHPVHLAGQMSAAGGTVGGCSTRSILR